MAALAVAEPGYGYYGRGYGGYGGYYGGYRGYGLRGYGYRYRRDADAEADAEPGYGYGYGYGRYGGYGAGFATGLLGFAQIFWEPNRQAIQDKISETLVIQLGLSKLDVQAIKNFRDKNAKASDEQRS